MVAASDALLKTCLPEADTQRLDFITWDLDSDESLEYSLEQRLGLLGSYYECSDIKLLVHQDGKVLGNDLDLESTYTELSLICKASQNRFEDFIEMISEKIFRGIIPAPKVPSTPESALTPTPEPTLVLCSSCTNRVQDIHDLRLSALGFVCVADKFCTMFAPMEESSWDIVDRNEQGLRIHMPSLPPPRDFFEDSTSPEGDTQPGDLISSNNSTTPNDPALPKHWESKSCKTWLEFFDRQALLPDGFEELWKRLDTGGDNSGCYGCGMERYMRDLSRKICLGAFVMGKLDMVGEFGLSPEELDPFWDELDSALKTSMSWRREIMGVGLEEI